MQKEGMGIQNTQPHACNPQTHPPTPNCNSQLTFLHLSTYKNIGTTPPARSQYSVLIKVTVSLAFITLFSVWGGPNRIGKQATSKQQASSKQVASTREMGKNQMSMVVLRIRPKFWWMLPMGVRDNHTMYELGTQRWRPGTGVASAGPPFQNLQFGAKISLFLRKTALEPAENGQKKGNSGDSTHAARLRRGKGPSRAL